MMQNPKYWKPLGEIGALIRKIGELEAGYPVMEMERLIEIGKPAVFPIMQVLEGVEGAVKPQDPLLFLVILGEIRASLAIDILLKFMLDTENNILADVACEALAKIGEPALKILEKIVTENKNILARIYAYGALGYMKHPAAHEILRAQLTRDPELVNVIATSLSEYGDRQDMEALYAAYRSLPNDIFNADMEEAVYLVVNPAKLKATPVEKNWRTRYRRLVFCGDAPSLSVLQIAAIVHGEFSKNRALLLKKARKSPKKELAEILSDEKHKDGEDQYCPDCSGKITHPTGLPVCSENACDMILFQAAILQSYFEAGAKTIPVALDMLDEEAKKAFRKNRLSRKSDWKDEINIKYVTLNFFLEQGEYQLKNALEWLSEIRERLKKPRAIDRRALEKVHSDMGRLMRDKNFTSIDEANKYLKELLDKHGHRVPAATPGNALEAAQDVMYEAWDQEDGKERIRLAWKALAVSPDCADAYVLLAEEAADNFPESRRFFQKGVEAGERALGQTGFKEHVGHFWGVLGTRPYMRARLGLAQTLWSMGEHQEAIKHYRELLRLNPNDNQGIRYILVYALAFLSRYDELEGFLESKEYPDDIAPDWTYTKALLCFRKTGPSPEASALFDKAKKYNSHVPDYLTGRKRIPDILPDMIKAGGEDEGYCYAEKFLSVWRRVPGALDWLDGRTETAFSLGGSARNLPCPCGSGRKYKKCCGKTVN